MKRSSLLLTAIFFLFIGCKDSAKQKAENTSKNTHQDDLAQYINPFIGTGGHGHTYPGASLPFGMVQLSPDTRLEGWDGCSGYHFSDSIVYGFSHTHLSGTGVPDYGDILFMPTVGDVKLNNGADNPDEGYASRFSHDNEIAEAGYYKTYLDDYGISVELTATKRTGIHKYTFPKTKDAHIIIDLQHRDKVIESGFSIISHTEIEGFRRSTAWANNQIVYFVAKFSKPFKDFGIAENEKQIKFREAKGDDIKAYLDFEMDENEAILVKVGISAISAENAWENLEKEAPRWDFDKIREKAKQAWNMELNRILINGGTKEQKIVFYTSLYHSFLVPNLFSDVSGEYRGMDFKTHEARGFDYYTVFSLWDTFRGEHPLFTLVQQKRTIDFIKTMIAQYEQGGRLPVWELAANETECMIGYHSIPVIVDAYMKGMTGFDVEKAYEAMKHSAEMDFFGLASYKEFGYIPAEEEAESVSKTLEYAYDDWCIAQMAKALGKDEDYKRFIQRAQSYKNIYDPSVGFMRARMNGRWFSPFDPKEVNFNFTEANSWQYSFFVPQDISGLIKLMGGKEAFENKLDALFNESSETTGRKQSDITGLIGQYAHGNEPSHHMAYLYDYIGKPWKTQERVREILNKFYTNEPAGLCGNEDCGQMSAWYVLSSMGFYPVTPGSNIYAIGSPVFPEVKINMENGKTFTIKANHVSPENIYIQSATLNGKPYSKSFLDHGDIINGGELVFEMGFRQAQPDRQAQHDTFRQAQHDTLRQAQRYIWGTKPGDFPVSAIIDDLILPVPFIVKGAKTFTENTVVQLGSATDNTKIFYTTDGTVPTSKSNEYSKPFTINKTTTVNAVSIKDGFPNSRSISVRFTKIPNGRKISLNTKYANQYSAGGNIALIDFIRGTKDFRTGAWQGYKGVGIDATVDLGSIQLIHKLEIGFMQDNNAWIFMPEKVDFYVSMDGKDFQFAGTLKNDVPKKQTGTILKNFTLDFTTKTRYIKVIAKNIGICPDWHKGAGNKSWIFADEIVVE
ncbi:MAG: glycoside hydrolase family 92 protein [Chlorobi bacterium]|nr:glycoside hydrolase family 92 protein [Chlorobiota bacterium]